MVNDSIVSSTPKQIYEYGGNFKTYKDYCNHEFSDIWEELQSKKSCGKVYDAALKYNEYIPLKGEQELWNIFKEANDTYKNCEGAEKQKMVKRYMLECIDARNSRVAKNLKELNPAELEEFFSNFTLENYNKYYPEFNKSLNQTAMEASAKMKDAYEALKLETEGDTTFKRLLEELKDKSERAARGRKSPKPRGNGKKLLLVTLFTGGLVGIYELVKYLKHKNVPVNQYGERMKAERAAAMAADTTANTVDSTKVVTQNADNNESKVYSKDKQKSVVIVPGVEKTINASEKSATDKTAAGKNAEYVVGSAYVIKNGDNLYKIARKWIHEYYASIGQEISDDDITETQLANCKRAMEKAPGFNLECVETNDKNKCTKYSMHEGDEIPRIDIAKVLGLNK